MIPYVEEKAVLLHEAQALPVRLRFFGGGGSGASAVASAFSIAWSTSVVVLGKEIDQRSHV
jgi:hypothetical protein